MAKFEVKLPRMGESVNEATLTAWLVEIGDTIDLDDGILEVSTDKVDTEIPSEVKGVLLEKRFEVDAVIKVGETIAVIEIEGEGDESISEVKEEIELTTTENTEVIHENITKAVEVKQPIINTADSIGFYSPLVRNIAAKENISLDELARIVGTGLNQRVTKKDIFGYLENRKTQDTQVSSISKKVAQNESLSVPKSTEITTTGDEIIPMDRMGKLIAKHMLDSIQTSAHVQSFIEIDLTKIVNWRNKVKTKFLQQKGEKLTFTPILMQAVAQTISEYPMVNISLEGTNIIKKKNINLGMAAALPNGNLIVPVIKNADELSLLGMAKAVNRLANAARNGKLNPDDISEGTYTVTNIGSFGSITGTAIINQPQVAILTLGAIRKMPAVIETPEGDFIGIRHKMMVSHSYDHRVINGALGGQFILRLKEILENFDENQTF